MEMGWPTPSPPPPPPVKRIAKTERGMRIIGKRQRVATDHLRFKCSSTVSAYTICDTTCDMAVWKRLIRDTTAQYGNWILRWPQFVFVVDDDISMHMG